MYFENLNKALDSSELSLEDLRQSHNTAGCVEGILLLELIKKQAEISTGLKQLRWAADPQTQGE